MKIKTRVFLFCLFSFILGCGGPIKVHFHECPAITQDFLNCRSKLDSSISAIKILYDKGNFDSINGYIRSWKSQCMRKEEIKSLQILIGIKTDKKVDDLCDTLLSDVLREDVGFLVDGTLTEDHYLQKLGSGRILFRQWISYLFHDIADTLNSSSAYYPLVLYFAGKKLGAFKLLETDSLHAHSPLGVFFKAVKLKVIGIKIIVPDNYATIEDAVMHAKDRDTIYIRNGKYKTYCRVKKRISFIGESRNNTIISGKYGKPCFQLDHQGSLISNISFTNSHIGILCLNSWDTIDNCLFYLNNYGICSSISLPEIHNSVFDGNKKAAIFLQNARSTRHSIRNNIFSKNNNALNCTYRTKALIQNNIIYKNKSIFKIKKDKYSKIEVTFSYNALFQLPGEFIPNEIHSEKNYTVEPFFISPGPPAFDYSLKNNNSFIGLGFEKSNIGPLPIELK
jgi:hypothetical protein